MAIAPIAGGFVQQHLGNATLWLGCAVVGAVAAGGQLLAGPARERRTATLNAAAPANTPESPITAEAVSAPESLSTTAT